MDPGALFPLVTLYLRHLSFKGAKQSKNKVKTKQNKNPHKEGQRTEMLILYLHFSMLIINLHFSMLILKFIENLKLILS